jgi:hypothetical protein
VAARKPRKQHSFTLPASAPARDQASGGRAEQACRHTRSGRRRTPARAPAARARAGGAGRPTAPRELHPQEASQGASLVHPPGVGSLAGSSSGRTDELGAGAQEEAGRPAHNVKEEDEGTHNLEVFAGGEMGNGSTADRPLLIYR